MATSYAPLLQPGQIGSLQLKNRIALAPMGENFGGLDGHATEKTQAYYEERARGGAGLIILGTTAVSWPSGTSEPHQLGISSDDFIPTLAQVVRALSGAVAALADGGAAAPEPAPQGLVERIKSSGPVARLRDRYRDLKAKAVVLNQIMAIKTGGKVAMPFDAKDWALHFANDLVVYYLIRTHWDRIMRQWLPNPWTYRYQWATVVYLVFLLVRFRKARK